MFVYIAPIADQDLFKIGKSSKPFDRILSLSKFIKFDHKNIIIISCHSDKNAYNMEQSLHKLCHAENIKSEFIESQELFSKKILSNVIQMVDIISKINNYTISPLNKEEQEVLASSSFETVDIKRYMYNLGQCIKRLRIHSNITQKQLAEKSDVSYSCIQHLEYGYDINLISFLKILNALGKIEWINTLNPRISISPMQLLRNGKERQRVR